MFGTVVPKGIVKKMMDQGTIAQHPSYRTGLLRDIHKEYFQCLPNYKDHDVIQQSDAYRFGVGDINSVRTIGAAADGRGVAFNAGSETVREFINSKVDPSFDMVYIRIHGRKDASNPSRLHYNLCCNHEVTYKTNTIEGRFMTPTHNKGTELDKAKAELEAQKGGANNNIGGPGRRR